MILFASETFDLFRLSGSNTVGKDTDGDGVPDVPLIYDMEEGSRIEFPLNFCPGKQFDIADNKKQTHVTPDHLTQPCEGQWGIALKEWQGIKQVSLGNISPDSPL